MTGLQLDQNRNVQVNWGTFNVPTIAGMFVIFAAVWSLSGSMQRQDSRLGNIEDSRQENAARLEARLAAMDITLAKIPNIDYRVTVNEQGLVATNARIDRVTDAVGSLRDGIAEVKTSIEVLTEQLKSSTGQQRSDLVPIPRVQK